MVNPLIPPPVPLVPPSLFGIHPSLPDLKIPGLSAHYWGRSPGIGGDYVRGTGINSLLYGVSSDTVDKDKLKKALYGRDLIN